MGKPGYNVYCPECDRTMKKSENGKSYKCPVCYEVISLRDAELAQERDLGPDEPLDDWEDWF